MDAKPPGSRPVDAATLARDLVDRLAAISASLAHGPDRAAGGRGGTPSAGPGTAPLADFSSPRAVLENGAMYVAPFLPAEAGLRPLKALLLRVLRVITRDQTVFNSAVLESLRGTLLAADGAFRETAAAIERARTEAEETARREAATSIARTEAAEQAQRDAEKRVLDALEKSRIALWDALRVAVDETQKSLEGERRNREEIASRLGNVERDVDVASKEQEGQSKEVRNELKTAQDRLRGLHEGLEETRRGLADLRKDSDLIASDSLATQVRVDGLEKDRDLLVSDSLKTQLRADGLEKDRDLLVSDSLKTQLRVDGLENDRDRLLSEASSGRVRFEFLEKERDRIGQELAAGRLADQEMSSELLKTHLRIDGLEKDRDGLLSEASSSHLRFELLERERDRIGQEIAAGERIDQEISAELLKTQVRVDGLEKDRDRLLLEASSGQVRFEFLEKERDRIGQEIAARGRVDQEISADLLKTQLRVDGLEKDRDRLHGESASAFQRLESLERDRDRTSDASASGARTTQEIAADLFRTQVRVDGLEKDRDRILDASSAGDRTAKGLQASLAALDARLSERFEDLRRLKLEWSTLRSELSGLAVRPARGGGAASPLSAPKADDLLRAGLYVDFEEGFRGSEKEIRKRQEADAALFRKAPGPVADLGCGRGEFLEALKAARIPAVGCDANPVMVARAKKKGLKVEKADLFEWLKARRDGSLGGITAYQVVEHFPPARLYELVELSAAKLAPGGVLLFETVNPESAYAMKWFWMDLTHVRPVPAPSLARLLTASGFRDVRIDWRSPVPESEAPPAELRDDAKLGPMMRLLFGPQDYAAIGRK
jgi:chromosome segregation ATPase